MGSVVADDIIRVTAKMVYNSGVDDVQNVFHMKFAGTTQDDAVVHAAIADALDTAYAHLANRMPTTTAFSTIATWNVTQDRPMIEDIWPVLTAGLGSGEAMPGQCAPLVLFDTDAPRSQGRKFLPFFRELDMTAGSLSGAAQAEMVSFVLDILANVVETLWQANFGNWSTKYARFAPFISAIVKTVVRTQRRRVMGVGS